MEAAQQLLYQKVSQFPEKTALSVALEALNKLLSDGRHNTQAAVLLLTDLETQGLWGSSDEERDILNALRSVSRDEETEGSGRFTLVVPPRATPAQGTVWRTDTGRAIVLAPEVHQEMNGAALLHVLATSPRRIISSGKSLRSVLTSRDAQRALRSDVESGGQDKASPEISLQEKVEEIVHRAFWDEARESLSSPTPSQQVARLKRLYADLYEAISHSPSLLPSSHPALITLGAPLSPTPAPLQSTRRHLIAVSTALRERCAPVRDEALDEVLASLGEEENNRKENGTKGRETGDASVTSLPSRIVDAFRALLRIVDLMRADLSSAVLTRVSDDELITEISRAARDSERSAVLNLCGLPTIRERWEQWIDSTSTELLGVQETSVEIRHIMWMTRLVQALGADTPIECPLPGLEPPPQSTSSIQQHQESKSTTNLEATVSPTHSTNNNVPLSFLFSVSDLLHLQNHLQAIVIAAVLRTLVPLRPTGNANPSSGEDVAGDKSFTERVLTLLMSEVEEDAPDAGTTKLAHLADEVVNEHKRLFRTRSSPELSQIEDTQPSASSNTNSGPDESALRSRVDNHIRTSSPIFALLRLRLLRTLTDALSAAYHSAVAIKREEAQQRVPEVMQTGRDRKRLRTDASFPGSVPSSYHGPGPSPERWYGHLRKAIDAEFARGKGQQGSNGPVGAVLRRLKGYDEPALQSTVRAALCELADIVDWQMETWRDVLNIGSRDVDASGIPIEVSGGNV